MTRLAYSPAQPRGRSFIRHELRILRVIAAVEFKTRYADSAMGYLWSFAKPLAYFGVLWLIFDRFLKITGDIPHFEIYLIVGIVLLMFFIDSVGSALSSIVTRGSILRRIRFSPIVLPLSVTTTALITFAVNVVAVAVFVAVSGLEPHLDWLLIVPLVFELYIFTLGVGLIFATLFVRFRDVAQIWELIAQLFIFATPLMFPASLLPLWAARVMFLNPFVQVMQDIRVLLVGAGTQERATAAAVYGTGGRLLPIAIAFATFFLGLFMFMRDAPHFAEKV
jgi:ABC-2 type transport system permease protein